VRDGTLPERDDISFHYDGPAGRLDLYQRDADGQRRLIFSGNADPWDSAFRDEAGEVIGIRLGNGVLIDPYAFPSYLSEAEDDDDAATGAQTRAEARRDGPRLCPDPTPENIRGRSEQALAYQEQITGLPRGLDVKFRAVRYDGCDESDGGTLEDAKARGYANFMTGPDTWYDWYRGRGRLERQMARQHDNAPDPIVEWHFAEKGPADYFADFVAKRGWTNVKVFFTPPLPRMTHEDMYKLCVRQIRAGATKPASHPSLGAPGQSLARVPGVTRPAAPVPALPWHC
jgi:hypothetical protein